ncbi:penicillin-binding protein 2 [Candidatus Dependentiae bacterium]|nr:penicillin-binding protein 2 [Candidatus Dependentiae bacterium]
MNKKKTFHEIVLEVRNGKIFRFLVVILFFVMVIILRLFYLQVHDNSRFARLGKRNFLRTERIPSRRGSVRDCHGNLLATNSPVFDLYWHGTGAHSLSRAQKKSIDKLMAILGADCVVYKKLARAERFSRHVLLKKDLTKDELCQISEQCSGVPNLVIDRHFKRVYPYKKFASHVLGYLRKAQDRGSFTGLSGLEGLFQKDLQGEAGYVQHMTNAMGRRLAQIDLREAVDGADVTLTLDTMMQRIAENLFVEGQAGAFVVMDPEDGAIRAMVSWPSFDPNLFLSPISEDEWSERLMMNSPLLNRAINALYPPASIFKLVTFVAGLEEGVITTDTEFTCEGYTVFGGRKYNCQRRWGHGVQSAKKALGVSCNIPCYEIAKKITIDQLAAYAMRFGLGQTTGFLFHDKSGLVPTSYWKQAHKGERWWKGETLSVGIGQSFLLVSPLQVVRMVASISNGFLVKPRILENEEVERYPLYVSDETLNFLREVMKEVVLRGTGRRLRSFSDFSICAKTGTAQIVSLQKQKKGSKKQLEHAWFASYFSYKNAKPLAMVVLVENAGSSRPALQIANKFFSLYRKVLS